MNSHFFVPTALGVRDLLDILLHYTSYITYQGRGSMWSITGSASESEGYNATVRRSWLQPHWASSNLPSIQPLPLWNLGCGGLGTSSNLRGRFCRYLLGTTCCSGRASSLGRCPALCLWSWQGSVRNCMKELRVHLYLGRWVSGSSGWVPGCLSSHRNFWERVSGLEKKGSVL